MNLFELMRGAGSGSGFESFGRQFGLTQDQFASALAAVLPAFALGLKRSAADPFAFPELMRRFGTGDYANYYRNPAAAGDRGRSDGEDVLALLFGSREVARAVAEQASAFTGLAPDKLQAMMPALAATLFGGMQQRWAAANPAFAEMLRQFGGAVSTDAPRQGSDSKGPLDRYEEEQERKAQAEAAENPFTHVQAEGMRAAMSAMTAGATTWADAMAKFSGASPEAASAETRRPALPPDGFGDLFEPGLRISEAYQRNLEAIFRASKPPG